MMHKVDLFLLKSHLPVSCSVTHWLRMREGGKMKWLPVIFRVPCCNPPFWQQINVDLKLEWKRQTYVNICNSNICKLRCNSCSIFALWMSVKCVCSFRACCRNMLLPASREQKRLTFNKQSFVSSLFISHLHLGKP